MKSAEEVLRQQNEQVVTFSLIEMLTQLLFVAMALALVLQNETIRRLSPGSETLTRLRAELAAKEQEVAALTSRLARLTAELQAERSLVARLMMSQHGTLPAPDIVPVTREDFDRLVNAKEMLDERNDEVVLLRAQLATATGRGVGRPVCLVTSGSLLRIRMLGGGGFQVSPAWSPGAAQVARTIPGIAAITAAAQSETSFRRHAAQIQAWGLAQSDPCTFRVTVSADHGNLSRYLQQLAVVEQFFYARRAR